MDKVNSSNSNNKKYKIVSKYLNKELKSKHKIKNTLIKHPSKYFASLKNRKKNYNIRRRHCAAFNVKDKESSQKNIENNAVTTVQDENWKSKESFVDLSPEFFTCPPLTMNSSTKSKSTLVTKFLEETCTNFSPKITSTPMRRSSFESEKCDLNEMNHRYDAIKNISISTLACRSKKNFNCDFKNNKGKNVKSNSHNRKTIKSKNNSKHFDFDFTSVNDGSRIEIEKDAGSNFHLMNVNEKDVTINGFHSAPQFTIFDSQNKNTIKSKDNGRHNVENVDFDFTSVNDSSCIEKNRRNNLYLTDKNEKDIIMNDFNSAQQYTILNFSNEFDDKSTKNVSVHKDRHNDETFNFTDILNEINFKLDNSKDSDFFDYAGSMNFDKLNNFGNKNGNVKSSDLSYLNDKYSKNSEDKKLHSICGKNYARGFNEFNNFQSEWNDFDLFSKHKSKYNFSEWSFPQNIKESKKKEINLFYSDNESLLNTTSKSCEHIWKENENNFGCGGDEKFQQFSCSKKKLNENDRTKYFQNCKYYGHRTSSNRKTSEIKYQNLLNDNKSNEKPISSELATELNVKFPKQESNKIRFQAEFEFE